MQVVLSMIQILPYIFDFIDISILDDNKSSKFSKIIKTDFYDLTDSQNCEINPRNSIKEKNEILEFKDIFLEYKYYFLDRLNSYRKCFNKSIFTKIYPSILNLRRS